MLESGAMAMRVDAAKLVPVLCDISEAELGRNPLTAFNYVHLTPGDVLKLVESINNSLAEKVPEDTLKKRFDKQWPDLEIKINIIIGTPDKETPRKKVSLEDSVEEMLSMLRLLVRKQEPGGLSLAGYLRNKEYFDALGSDNEKVNVFFTTPGSGKTKSLYDLLKTYIHEDEPKPKDRKGARKPKSGGNEPTNDEDK
jgi:hypothetical protein